MHDANWPSGWATDADRDRFRRYREARAFEAGDQWLGRPRPGETRLTVNYARTLVRKVAAYVFPAPATFAVPAGDERLGNRAEVALGRAIAVNNLARLDVDLCIEASVLGDAALKVTWDAARREPVVVAVDPAALVATTAPDHPRRIERVAHRYVLPGAAVERLFGGVGALDPARSYPVIEAWTDERWSVQVGAETIRDEANPYGWIPFLVLPNDPRPHDLWGVSDLVDLYDTCRELNARLSVLSRVLELSGAPIAVLENVDRAEGIAVGPGATWVLPEGARAYLLDLLGGGGAGLHMEYIETLYRALHDLSETPRTAFGDSGRVLSGAALEVEVQPLVQKVGRKRQGWDALYRERNARILDLLERFGGEELGGLRQTTTIWPGVLPSDRDSAVRNAVALAGAGIQSRRSAIAALGSPDPDAELARITGEGWGGLAGGPA